MRPGLTPDAFAPTCDGVARAGHSQLAELTAATAAAAGGSGSPVAVLAALRDIHWQIHRAFCEYQQACAERRQLAVEVGELAVQLTDALCAAGFSRQDARRADVHQLAQAWPASGEAESWR